MILVEWKERKEAISQVKNGALTKPTGLLSTAIGKKQEVVVHGLLSC